jgi:hypothetical protein
MSQHHHDHDHHHHHDHEHSHGHAHSPPQSASIPGTLLSTAARMSD